MSSVFNMVSSALIISACLVALTSAAPQFRAALPPAAFQQLGAPLAYPAHPGLPYHSSALPVVRNTPLPAAPVAYHQPAYTLPSAAPRAVGIISQTNDINFDGTYTFGFQSEDGTAVQSSGAQRDLGPEEPGQASSGSFSYIAPDGTPITTNWYADETGFHAEGDHLPKGPEGHIRSQ